MMSVTGIVFLFALCSFAVVNGDPTTVITISEMKMKNTDNPHIGEWSVNVVQNNKDSVITVGSPVKKELPADTMVKLKIAIDGSELPEIETTLCEAIKDKMIGEDLGKTGPLFPKDCPVLANDYKVENFVVDAKKIPPGVPDGNLVGSIEIYSPDKPAMVTVDFKGKLAHDPKAAMG